MSVEDKLLEVGTRAIRWVQGSVFPPGFDEWFQLSSPSPVKFTSPPNIGDFHRADVNSDAQRAQRQYLRAVTEEGKRWISLTLDLENRYINEEWNFEFPLLAGNNDPIKPENTHIWEFKFKNSIGGIVGSLKFTNLRTHSLHLDLRASKTPIRFVNCVIGGLILPDLSPTSWRKS